MEKVDKIQSKIDPERIARKAEEAARRAVEHMDQALQRMEQRHRAGRYKEHFRFAPKAPSAEEPARQEEVMAILKMVEAGKINAEEAGKLIEALGS